MTENIWRSTLSLYERHGTVTEQLMSRMILRLMEMEGSEPIVDRFSSDLLEGQL